MKKVLFGPGEDYSDKVDGPDSSTNLHVAVFDGTTGKKIKDSGYTIAKSIPSDAKFSDTTYSAATTSVEGLMSAADKEKLNGIATGATANTGTITGITMNGASKGTSGVVDLGTVLTSHQDISGKVSGPSSAVSGRIATFSGTTGKVIADSGYTIAKSVPSDAKFSDTTYSSLSAASGGTAVSLVTTGEKYTWNSKTANTGTVTSVAASGSGGISISGSPITTSGTITIGLNLSTAINGLSAGTSNAQRADYLVAQYAGGGTTTTTYHRRSVSAILAAMNKSDVTTALGYTPATQDVATTTAKGLMSAGDKALFSEINTVVGSFGHISFTATTSANGNVSKTWSSAVRVLNAYSTRSDTLVIPFPASSATDSGKTEWWFHCMSSNTSHSVVANTSVTIHVMYVVGNNW